MLLLNVFSALKGTQFYILFEGHRLKIVRFNFTKIVIEVQLFEMFAFFCQNVHTTQCKINIALISESMKIILK